MVQLFRLHLILKQVESFGTSKCNAPGFSATYQYPDGPIKSELNEQSGIHAAKHNSAPQRVVPRRCVVQRSSKRLD